MDVDRTWDGLIVVDKPLGPSSMDVVRRVRYAAKQSAGKKVKTGHAGTLDPLATGVVICCLGRATRAVEQLMGQTKIYEAEVDLSAFTTTDDREGERTEVAVPSPPSVDAIDRVLTAFVGSIEQAPPSFSAIHVNGKRAYKLARQGEVVEIPSRTVRVDAIERLGYDWPTLTLRITCGKGTYIRSLARDIGKALHTGGHLASLRRTAVGRYTLEQARPWDYFDNPLDPQSLLEIPMAPQA